MREVSLSRTQRAPQVKIRQSQIWHSEGESYAYLTGLHVGTLRELSPIAVPFSNSLLTASLDTAELVRMTSTTVGVFNYSGLYHVTPRIDYYAEPFVPYDSLTSPYNGNVPTINDGSYIYDVINGGTSGHQFWSLFPAKATLEISSATTYGKMERKFIVWSQEESYGDGGPTGNAMLWSHEWQIFALVESGSQIVLSIADGRVGDNVKAGITVEWIRAMA